MSELLTHYRNINKIARQARCAFRLARIIIHHHLNNIYLGHLSALSQQSGSSTVQYSCCQPHRLQVQLSINDQSLLL